MRSLAAHLLVAFAALIELGGAQNCATDNFLDRSAAPQNLNGVELGACAHMIATGRANCADDFGHGARMTGGCNYECGLNLLDVSVGPGQCSGFIAAGVRCADSFSAGAQYAGYCDFECGYCSEPRREFDCQANERGTVYIGGLFDLSIGSELQNSPKQHFEFAAGLLSRNDDGWFDDLLPGISITTRSLDTSCNHVSATSAVWQLSNGWTESTVVGNVLETVAVPLHGVIGSFACEEASKGVATLTRLQEVPQVSGMETSPELSDRAAYPYHFRTVAPNGRASRQLKAVISNPKFLNTRNVGVIYTDTPEARAAATEFIDIWANSQLGAGGDFRGGILSQCKVTLNPDDTTNQNSTQQCFLEVNSLPKERRPRVIVLAASSDHGVDIINMAVDFYLPGGFKGWDTGRWWVGLGSWADNNTALALGSKAGFLALRPNVVSPSDCSDVDLLLNLPKSACVRRGYLERWQENQRLTNIAAVDQQLCDGCAETVDALLALVVALDAARCDVAAAGIHNLQHGSRVREYLRNVTLHGLSGPVAFDANGDRATSRFDIYIYNWTFDTGQWRRIGTLQANVRGGVEPAEEELGDPDSVPTVEEIAVQMGSPSGTDGTYASDGFCTDGTQCLDPSLPHCDVDYDAGWRWEPGATGTVEGVPRNLARGTCVPHTDVPAHTCAAPMYLYQNAQGSTHHMTLYGNETTSCFRKNATSFECRKGGRNQPVVPEPANLVAGMCAEYLPAYVGADEMDNQKDVQVCCRLGDRKLESWFLERWQDQEIRFGQCENCRNAARKVLCQTACDINNWRFHASSKILSSAPTNSLTTSDAVVCPQFCKNFYKACREVIWSQDIKHMPQYKTDGGNFRFCKDALRLEVASEESWGGLGGAWSVDDNDPIRICTVDSQPEPVHCSSEQAYRTKGAVGTILCVFAVASLLGTDKITNRMLPSTSITLIAGFLTGFLIDYVLASLEQELRGTHLLINSVLLKPEALGLFLLPVMIFSTAFNMEHHATIFMWLTFHRISLFAIVGTIISILCTGGLLLVLDRTLENGVLEYQMSFQDAIMFGSLISAVDPAGTLAVFDRIGIDPRISSLIHGESLVCRCVCVVAFGTIKQFGVSQTLGEDATAGAAVAFCALSIGSILCGLCTGVWTALFFKTFGDPPETEEELEEMQKVGIGDLDSNHVRQVNSIFKALDTDQDGGVSMIDIQMMDTDGDGVIDKQEFKAKVLKDRKYTKKELHYKRHRAVADGCVFCFSSFLSYFMAEALGLSGIVSASICAIACNQFSVRNMTFDAREYGKSLCSRSIVNAVPTTDKCIRRVIGTVRSFYVTLAEITEQIFMLWIGVLYYMSSFDSTISASAIGMVSGTSRLTCVLGCAEWRLHGAELTLAAERNRGR